MEIGGQERDVEHMKAFGSLNALVTCQNTFSEKYSVTRVMDIWTALASEDNRHGLVIMDISFLETLKLDSGQFASESWSSTPYK
jgi:hypothetical protein